MDEELKIKIKAVIDDAQSKIDSVKKQLNGIEKTTEKTNKKIGSSLSSIAKKVAAAFAVVKIINFGKECLKLGSDLAEVQNVVDVTFGSMASKVDNFAKKAITSYGLSEKVAKEYMGTLGAMSKSFGNTTSAAYEQAEVLTALTGDVASFYNLSSDEAFTKMKAVYTGETESLKSLGVVMTETALNEFALAKGYGKTTKAMTEQEKVALRLAFVQEKLSGASGDFVRTADGWANQTRVLSLRIDALKASIGQGLINVLTPVIKTFNIFISRIQVAADAFQRFTTTIFGNAGGSNVSEAMSQSSTVMANNFSKAEGTAKKIQKTLQGFDELNVLSSGTSGSTDNNSVGANIPLSGGSNDMTAKVNLDVDPSPAMKTLVNIKNNIVSTIKSWGSFFVNIGVKVANDLELKQLGKDLLGLIDNSTKLASTVSETITPALETFYNKGISPIVSWIGEKLRDAIKVCKEHLDDWGKWFKDNKEIIDKFAEKIGELVNDVWELIEPLADAVWETFKGVLKGVREAIQGSLKWILENGDTLSSVMWGMVAAFTAYKVVVGISKLLQLYKDGLLGIQIAVALLDAKEKIMAVTQGLLNAVMSANPIALIVAGIAGLVAAFVLLWNKCEGFRNFWKGLWDGIKNVATKCWDGLKSSFKIALNGIIGYINIWIKGLNILLAPIRVIILGVAKAFGKKIAFDDIKIPSIPKLAKGGIVDSPTVAMFGEAGKEAVVPLENNTEWIDKLAERLTPKTPTRIALMLDGKELGYATINNINSITKQTGALPLVFA